MILRLLFVSCCLQGLFGIEARSQFTGPLPLPVPPDRSAASFGYSGYMHLRNTERGIPLDVHALLLDREGVLWAALDRGILRCEGDLQTLYPYSRAPERGLPPALATTLAELADGVIAAGTQHGVAFLDPIQERWTHRRLEQEGPEDVEANRIWQLVPLDEHRVWLLTGAGPFRYDRLRASFEPAPTPWPVDAGIDLGPIIGNNVARLNGGDTLIWATGKGLILAHIKDRTIRRITHGSDRAGASSTRISRVTFDPLGGIWWWDEDQPGIQYTDRSGERYQRFEPPDELRGEQVRTMHVDRKGSIWIGTWSGRTFLVNPWEGTSVELFRPGSPYFDGRKVIVREILGDHRGRVWLATDQGIMVFLPEDPRISRIPVLNSNKLDQGIMSLALMSDGMLLVGLHRGGLVVVDPRSVKQRALRMEDVKDESESFGLNSITGILPAQGPWPNLLGTSRGLLQVDRDLTELVRPDWATSLHGPGGASWVTSLAVANDGRLWVSTWSDGLVEYDPSTRAATAHRYRPQDPDGLPFDRWLCMLPERDGTIWFGANDGGGLCRYEPGTGRFAQVRDGTEEATHIPGVIRCLTSDGNGSLWIGSHDSGLYRYTPDSGTVRHFDRSDGVPGDRILALLAHRRAGLWAAGTEGVARWSPAAERFIAPSYGIRWTKYPAALLLDTVRSQLYVANQDEVVRIDLDAPVPFLDPAPPLVRNLRINGSPVARSRVLRLTKGVDRVAMDITSQDPVLAHATSLAYRLTGTMAEWEERTGGFTVSFTDLPTGDHVLEARTLGVDGAWSTPVPLLTIQVEPPWYATWWFRTLLILLIALLGVTGTKVYLNARLRKQRLVLERQQALLAERMRIAQDMHDDLGAGLSGLKLKSEMALRMEPDPSKREQLKSLATTAGEIIGGMRHIIWAMNEDQSSLEDLVVYCISHARQYAQDHSLHIEVRRTGQWPSMFLRTEHRRNVLLLVKEALHNIVKHAQASTVILHMDWTAGMSIVIEDDGIGLASAADQGAGNGLRNMRRRVEALGGTITFTVPAGTRVEIHIPSAGLRP